MRNDQYKQYNCYTVLNIPFNATPSEIKAAHRKMSLVSHPDKGGSHEKQVKINLAYEILSDVIQKRTHDTYWKVYERKSSSHKSNNKKQDKPNHQSNSTDKSARKSDALSTFKKKLDDCIKNKKNFVWSQLSEIIEKNISSIVKRRKEAQKTFFYVLSGALLSAAFSIYQPLSWIAVSFSVLWALSLLKGVKIDGNTFPLFFANNKDIEKAAEEKAKIHCSSLEYGLNQYNDYFASIIDISLRGSSFDDSEIQVTRRIVISLFFMGYKPVYYSGEARSILVADGDVKLVLRFRHRTGPSINITYVQKLHALMQLHKAEHGILFCSPGLSGNAALYAQKHGIKWHSLESMNNWIDDILSSDYGGPNGDALDNLKVLTDFISRITPQVGRSYYRSHGYRF
jgi:curved DNA-binding protein CbpA